MASAQSLFDGGNLGRPLEFDGNRESVAVEDGRVNHLQGQCGPAAGGERGVMAANPRLDRAQADFGGLAQPGEQVIGRLRVVKSARQPLKTEQAHGLLVKLVQGCAAKLACRLEQRGKGCADRGGLLEPFKHQRQRQRRRVRRDHGGGKQVGGNRLGNQPGRANQHARLLVESAREVEDR